MPQCFFISVIIMLTFLKNQDNLRITLYVKMNIFNFITQGLKCNIRLFIRFCYLKLKTSLI